MNCLDVAEQAARAAGEVLKTFFGRLRADDTEYKGPTDLVTRADREAEAVIRDVVCGAFPGYFFLSEEAGYIQAPATEARDGIVPALDTGWVVDPLDGTTNYVHGIPHYAVSIALQRHGELVVGVVYAPQADEIYVAEKGSGATRDGLPISVSTRQPLSKALVATGFDYAWSGRTTQAREVAAFLGRCMDLRRMGAAALDMAYVACGRFDLFWEDHVHLWDIAAGSLIVTEAGGVVSDFTGKPFGRSLSTPSGDLQMLASNGLLHQEALDLLGGVRTRRRTTGSIRRRTR